ncbi:MAG: hypothetical protein Kow00105_03570 [Phycisphaeraceae bacterium]
MIGADHYTPVSDTSSPQIAWGLGWIDGDSMLDRQFQPQTPVRDPEIFMLTPSFRGGYG